MGARPFTARTKAELARVLSITNPDAAAEKADEALALAADLRAAGILSEVKTAVAAGGLGN